MKTLRYILGIIIFISFGNVLYGQVSISTASPNPACIGDIVTIVGNDMKPTYLKLKQAGGVDIDLSGNIQAGATATQIKVLLSSAIIGAVSGTVEFEVEKNTGVAGTSKVTKAIVLNPTPQVTLSVQGGNTVCSGGSATLNFTVSNSDGGSVLINYIKGGTPATTTATGDGIHSVVVSPITTPTIYTLVSAKLTTCTNVTTITGQSQTITITPTPTVAFAIQGGNNTICPGQNAILNFTVGNSGGANVTINYTVNGVAAATVASGNGTHSVTVSPTVQTDYAVTSATIGTCTTPITNQDETININAVADVTLSVQGGTDTICSGESATLNFTVSNSSGGNVTIQYSKNGVLATTTANGNGIHTVSVTPTTTTLYTIISTTTATGCTKTITNQSQTITVQPNLTGTLTASANTICNGESVSLFFTANNPNGDNLIFHYKKGTTNLTATTTGTFVSVSSGALSAQTTFTLESIENTTTNCTKNITTNNSVTIAVNNTMGATMTSSVSSLCFGGNYDLIFAITGTKANDNITILYSQDGITIPFNVIINATNTNTTAIVNILGNQTHSHNLVSITNNTTGCFTNYTPSAVNSIQVNVTPPISAAISASSTSICNGANTNLIFSVSNPNNETLTIKYTDGTTIFTETTTTNSKVVSISPSISKTYTLSSVQTTACTFTFVANNFVTITVNKVPTVTVALIGSGIACSGTSAQIEFTITNKNSPTDNITVQYLDNNGLQSFSTQSTSHIVSVSPPTTTVFSLVSATNTTVGCSNFNLSGAGGSVTVTAGNNLTGELQVSKNEICAGESVTLNFIINGASGNTNLAYTTNNGAVQTLIATGSTKSLTLPLTTSTTFQLTGLTAVNTGCPGSVISGSSTQTITVNSLPNANLTAINGGNTTAICKGQSTNLEFNITGGTPPYSLSYEETIAAFNTNLTIPTSGTTSISVTPLQNSIYNITSIIDSKSCPDVTPTGSATVTVNDLPSATLSVTNNVLCKGQSTILVFTVANNGTDNVTIAYNEITSNATTPKTISTNGTATLTVTPTVTTTYTITGITNTVTNCSGLPTANNSKTITVKPLPSVTVATIGNTATVCNSLNSTLEFTFLNNGSVSPFTVFYQDSFSNQTVRSTIFNWNNLTFNSILNLPQVNTSTSPITHTYFITKVIDGNGCETNYSIGNQPSTIITINPTPVVTLNGIQTLPYASSDNVPYPIQGVPGGGTISGAGVGITNQSNTTANFIPANVNAVFTPPNTSINVVLTYSLTDGAGCTGSNQVTAVIKEAANYNFFNNGTNNLTTQYCRNSDSLYIYATVDNNGTVGAIGGNSFVLNSALNNKIFKNPQIFGDTARITVNPLDSSGIFSIQFGSTASGFITKQITIVDTINTSFSPFINGDTLCQTAGNVRLIGIPTLADNSNATFSSPTLGLITSNIITPTNTEWFMEYNISGEHQVKYKYTDIVTGCVTNATQKVNITPSPIADYTTNINCNNKSISFIDNSIIPTNIVSDVITKWEWEYGDGNDSTRNQFISSLNYLYNASGSYHTSLKVTSAFGCTDVFDTMIVIGTRPNMNFSWRFPTLGENTELVNLSTANLAGVLIDNVNNLTWNFGDGTPNLTTTLDTASHLYGNTGVFQVNLTAETDNGCISDTTFNVFILPKIDIYPYYERFDTSDGEWIANPIEGNVWQWADSLVYNNSNRGWTTDSASTYPLGSDIFLFSPIFNFTTIEKPLVTFQYQVNSRVSDGAIFQYSIDDGQTWNVLGDLNSGLEWYNVDNLVAQPGGQSGLSGLGWSGSSDTDWKVARHKLDQLKGQPKVRFRFAFASVEGGIHNFDGFTFDDFFIGDRQKRVLLENFTNIGTPSYNPIQDTIYQRLANNDLDVVMVEYHNALPTNDAFNLFNPADPSGRALYYQFSQTGKTVIDGEIYNTVTPNTTNFEWSQLDLDLNMLKEPIFNISIDDFNINNGVLNVTTTLKARKPLPAEVRKVYIAVIENDVNLNAKNHKNVLRKLLPSNAATSLTNNWAIGTAQTITQSWTFNPNNVDATKLKVVIWIQNNQSREVYQTAFSDFPNTLFDSTVVNTKTPLENTENMVFNLFPNPNNGNFTITFSSPMTTKTNWQLIDINGQIIHQGQITAHQENGNITTNDLPKGMYFFRMYNEKGISEVKKIIVE